VVLAKYHFTMLLHLLYQEKRRKKELNEEMARTLGTFYYACASQSIL
jgi:hypothetical protein